MMKRRLFTPGPTPVPERAMLRMAEPLIHHRTAGFRDLLKRATGGLQYLFQTEQPVITLTCSGTGGMEAAFVNLLSPGDTVIAVNAGKFGERWVRMAETFGLIAVEIMVPWGKTVRAEQLQQALERHPNTRAVFLTQSETSTGTATDIRAMAGAVRRESDALVCVDGISSIGALECRFDAWGIDACVTASQKGLMIPPGLAFVAVSDRAVEAIRQSTMPRFYFDLRRALTSLESADTPWTPAISLVTGLDAALESIRQEGIENVWRRHHRLAHGLRAGIRAVGLELFSEAPSDAVTAIRLPSAISGKALRSALSGTDGVVVAGGQGEFADTLVRVAHLGYFDDLDVISVVAALERALASLHWNHQSGAGVAAAHQALLAV